MINSSYKGTIGSVVISAGNSPAAFDIVRSLGREGICTTVASAQPDDMAYHSAYCSGAIPLFPFAPDTEEENLERLIGFAYRQSEPPVLYYASDPELSFVRRHRETLQRWFRFLLPTDFVLECLFNKVHFSSFATAYRLPVPTTIVAHDVSELPQLLSTIEFPCIVKPAFSEDWQEQWERFGPYKKALHRMTSAEELIAFCTALPKRQSGFLIQSYIDGRDESIYSFHGYFDEQSNCHGYFVGRKIRTYPPHTGGSTFIQTCNHPTLAELSIKYLQRIRFQGIVKIDYKWDAHDKEFKILEINPRYNLWEVLGAYAGVNLVYLAYRHQRGMTYEPQFKYRENVRLLYFKQDIRAFTEGYYQLKEWGIIRYMKSLMQKNHFRVWDVKDIAPFFFSVYSFIKRNVVRSLSFSKTKLPVRSGEIKGARIRKPQAAGVFDEVLH
ncbi:MAG: ATP-grasp domain-containing protein [Ignavibacteriales bacterium]|nr:ATP-grasp domain-containing protein [Ignavibacteriales bacterium]